MPEPEHLRIIGKGIVVWNEWRRNNREARPDFSDADFRQADLRGADLRGVLFRRAVLSGAQLAKSDLTGADLTAADFTAANLSDAKLNGAKLSGTILRGASLYRADFVRASLIRADLTGADLTGANLREVRIVDADLSNSRFLSTILISMDLRQVRGLELVEHTGPSSISIDTLYASEGLIPAAFLRGAGVPEDVVEHLLPLIVSAGSPIQRQSCFISYSHEDEEFAKQVHSRMRQERMRVWLASEDMKGGQKLHEQVFEAIQDHDRLLLVLSDASIRSEWVMTEIRKAREVERREKRRKLFPVRLVSFEQLEAWTCFDADSRKDLAVEVREYFIPDFSNWKDRDAFEAGFERLQADLNRQPDSVGMKGERRVNATWL